MGSFEDLPIDIIIEISYHCLPPTSYLSPNPTIAPLLLTRICSSWRTSIHGVPRLWSSLSQQIPCCKRDGTDTSAKLVRFQDQYRLWCRNSGQTQFFHLHLSIIPLCKHEEFHESSAGQPSSSFWLPLVELVAQNTINLRSIFLETEDAETLLPFWKLSSTSLPVLEAFQLSLTSVYGSRERQLEFMDGLQFISSAPCLRRVLLNYPHMKRNMDSLPYAQLTKLVITSPMTELQFRGVLSESPNLQDLSVALTHPPVREANESSRPAIHLKNLSVFDLTFNQTSEAPQLTALMGIHFPSLQDLAIRNDISGIQLQWDPTSSAQDHLYRQLQNLRSLTLGFQQISFAVMRDLFRHTPQLNKLALDTNPVHYAPLIEALTYSGSEQIDPLLPRLTDLELYVEISAWIGREPDGHLIFTSSQFISMVRSRSIRLTSCTDITQAYPLKRVVLYVENGDLRTMEVDEMRAEFKRMTHTGSIDVAFELVLSDTKNYWLQFGVQDLYTEYIDV